MRKRTNLQFLRVSTVQRIGRRVYLRLVCGHLKLHNPRLPTPYKTYCPECPERRDEEVPAEQVAA